MCVVAMQVNKVDWLVFTVCFLVTILADVEIGLVTAIGLAIAIVVLKSGFPHTAVLGRLPKSNVFRYPLPFCMLLKTVSV